MHGLPNAALPPLRRIEGSVLHSTPWLVPSARRIGRATARSEFPELALMSLMCRLRHKLRMAHVRHSLGHTFLLRQLPRRVE